MPEALAPLAAALEIAAVAFFPPEAAAVALAPDFPFAATLLFGSKVGPSSG